MGNTEEWSGERQTTEGACWRAEISLYLGWDSVYCKIVYVFQDLQKYTLKRVNFTVYELILKKKIEMWLLSMLRTRWFSFCSHISAKALYSMLLWISPVSRGVKIRWFHCFGRESHLHGIGQRGTWSENSDTSPLFRGQHVVPQGPNKAHHLFL